MSSSSNFGLTEDQVVYELASVLHSSILDILGYGIYTSIYFVSFYTILSRGTERPRIGSVVLITIMWLLVTIHASLQWTYIDNVYIRHGESREAQLTSVFLSRNEELYLQHLSNVAVTFISILLVDMTMIWRCWVLHGRRWFIIIIPGLSLVAGSVCYVWRSILIFTRPNPIWIADQINRLELTFLSTTVLTNIFCTAAIIYRPLRVSGWRELPKARTYRRIIEILVESSILYTAIHVIRIGLQIYSQYFNKEVDERLFFPQALGYSITGITPTLIIVCLTTSHARPADAPRSSVPLPNMESTIQYFTESSRLASDRPATTHTIVQDVDAERSRFSEDLDGPEVDGNSHSDNLISRFASGKVRGQLSFKDAQV